MLKKAKLRSLKLGILIGRLSSYLNFFKEQKKLNNSFAINFKIVIVFVISWTPYYIISILIWTNPSLASKIDEKILKLLFIFAVANCLANPVVYGIFLIR